MTDNMKKFLEKVSSDKELRKHIRRMTQEEIIHTANELGFPLTADDFVNAKEDDALTEDELKNVTGGSKPCNCIGGGSGVSWDDFKCGYNSVNNGGECDCVSFGTGAFAFGD